MTFPSGRVAKLGGYLIHVAAADMQGNVEPDIRLGVSPPGR